MPVSISQEEAARAWAKYNSHVTEMRAMETEDTLLSANQYIAVVGVAGMALWFGTQAVIFTRTFEVTSLFGVTGGVIGLWLAYIVGYRLLGAVAVDTRVWVSSPFLLWLLVSVLAIVGNGVGVVLGDTATGQLLMWSPWGVAFVVGYLGTWFLVDRGGVYLLAAAGSAAFVVVAAFASVSGLHYAILGLLHGVPMIIDAARGGRELTEDGTPALKLS